MSKPVRIAMIYGSTREGRFCDIIAGWAAAEIERRGDVVMDVIDPAAYALPLRHEAGTHGDLEQIRQRLDAADAFVVVTPEYNHSFPAALKAVIDAFYAEWRAKPVAFVSYGGISGGSRAVEQLRQVFAELHAVTMRDSVPFINAWEQFDETGTLRDPERARKGMARMLGQLHWWAVALRNARQVADYSEVA